MRILFFVFYIFISLGVLGQEQKIDSILKLISNEKENSKKIAHYENFCYKNYAYLGGKYKDFVSFDSLFLKTNYSKKNDAFDLLSKLFHLKVLYRVGDIEQADSLYKTIQIQKKIDYYYRFLMQKAEIKIGKFEIDSAIIVLKSILEKDTKPKKEVLAQTYFLLSYSNQRNGHNNLAIKNLMMCDSLTSKKNKNKIAILNQLGRLYMDVELYDIALQNIRKGKQLILSQEKIDSNKVMLFSYHEGLILNKDKQIEQSDSISNFLIDYYTNKKNTYMLMFSFILKARNLLEEKKYQKIIDLLDQDQFREIQEGECNLLLAIAYTELGSFLNAEKYFHKVENSKWIENKENREAEYLNYFSLFYQKSKNYKKAYTTLFKLNELNQKKASKSNSKLIYELNTIYNTQKKETENEKLKLDKLKLEQSKKNQLLWLLIGIFILIFLVTVLFLLYKNRKTKNRQLEELDHLKSKFFESISHEIRTPLTLIDLPIKKALTTNSNTISTNDLKVITQNSNRLKNLVDDIATIAKIESNSYLLQKENASISSHVNLLVNQFNSLAEEKKIIYNKTIFKDEILAYYNKEVVEKTIINLISNGIKYNNPNGKLDVIIEIKDKNLYIKISDTGVGIKKEHHSSIFNRFYRVEQNNEAIPGSGIGLSIVKELIDLSGGAIYFESKINIGTTFFVTLPLNNIQYLKSKPNIKHIKDKPSNKQIIYKSNFPLDNADKPHILIVEDNAELLNYIAGELKQDYKVFTAKDGEEGLQKAFAVVPDVIITDWIMPNKTGLELSYEIKNNTITNHIPIIMLTAKSDLENKEESLATGIDNFFAKPFDMSLVKLTIKNLIFQRQKIIEKFTNGAEIPSSFSEKDLKFWNQLKILVKENLDNSSFTIQDIADKMFVSRMQLNRKLKAISSIGANEYLLQERMKKAAKLLAQKDVQIAEISYKVGYDNPNSFSRTFKKFYGVSPSNYNLKNSN